jgi:hypothetical protein
MADEPYRKMQQAAWAAFRKDPDPDGIRRVHVLVEPDLEPAVFCLTDSGAWFLTRGDGVLPDTPLHPCPVDWVPPEFRETRSTEEI